jgi:ketopantoate reductase
VRALIVGAGAVGQVYGRHLARGGAEVSFFVKAQHADAARKGFVLYALNRWRGRRVPERFEGYGVLTAAGEAAEREWDQVYLTVSSPALRGGWLGELGRAIKRATVVVLQPGPDDRRFVARHLVDDDQVVQGIITVISYQAPLPEERRFPEPGVAYWLPPLAASPLGGAPVRVAAVVAALKRGGLPARQVKDIAAAADFASALSMPLLAVLEAAGWSMAAARGRLGLATRAAAESLAIAERRAGRRAPLPLRLLLRPPILRPLLVLAPLVFPLDLERYLRFHFTKVGDQTREVLRGYLTSARDTSSPAEALAEVAAGIGVQALTAPADEPATPG